MKLYKQYVKVAAWNEDGYLIPIAINWDGTVYKIDKITDVRKAKSAVGGCGLRYICQIGKSQRNLFYEINKWFIESHEPPQGDTLV